MGIKKAEAERQEQIEEELRRIKLPRGRETLGIVDNRVGGGRMIVKCLDGKTRNCRIPGRLKRKLWVRNNDIVIVEPWQFNGDEKGDVLFKYRPVQVDFLKKKGYLKAFQDMEEF